MLEDRDIIDMVVRNDDGSITLVILDPGTLVSDRDCHLEAINHKIQVCVSLIGDDEKFEELGKPEVVTIEIRCNYSLRSGTADKHLTATFPSGRQMNYTVKFVESISPYGSVGDKT